MYVSRSWARWMDAHTLTRTEEMLAIHSSLRLNQISSARARTRTHQEITMFASPLIGIGSLLVACVASYIVCCLVWYTRPIVASSSHRKGVSRIRHAHIDVQYVQYTAFHIQRFRSFWRFIRTSVRHADDPDRPHKMMRFFFLRSIPKLNAKYECKAPAYLNILICCLAFYLVNDSKGLVGGVLSNSWNFYAPHHSSHSLTILAFVWIGESLVMLTFAEQT